MRTSNKIKKWEGRFHNVLVKRHKHYAKNVFHRLMKKSTTLKTSLKRRAKEYEVEFDITLDEVREMILSYYCQACKYCNRQLDVTNIVCDHIDPLSNGGGSVADNLQMICSSCNTRKGNLSDTDYRKLINWLAKQSKDMRSYVMRKLAKGDNFN